LHGLHHLCRRDSLADAAENLVTPAFQAEVDNSQFLLSKYGKLGIVFAQDITGIGIDSYTPQAGKRGCQRVQDSAEQLGVQHQGVSVRQEDAPGIGRP
jgi:hypothetical protein